MKNTFATIALIMISILLLSSCRNMVGKKAYMRKTYRSMKRNVKDGEVTKLKDTVKVLFPSNLMFANNSATLDSSILHKIHRFAKALNKFHKTSILIGGHTDSKGDYQYNIDLSAKRADSTKDALLYYKVAENRMYTWGLGMKHPVATNKTAAGRAKNRRVEFIILYQEQP